MQALKRHDQKGHSDQVGSTATVVRRSTRRSVLLFILALISLLLAALALQLRIRGIDTKYLLDPLSITSESGVLYLAPGPKPLRGFEILTDSDTDPTISNAILLQSGKPFGTPHSEHGSIRAVGNGRFSHWNATLYFSTSDNSDPTTNGHTYEIKTRQFLKTNLSYGVLFGSAGVLLVILLFAGRSFITEVFAVLVTRRAAMLASIVAVILIVIDASGVPASISIESASIRAEEGLLYVVPLDDERRWFTQVTADDMGTVAPSTLRVFEDDREIGPPHSEHIVIKRYGRGRFSHWRGELYFSASDNSDPRANGRIYRAEGRATLRGGFFYGVLTILSLVVCGYLVQARSVRSALVSLLFMGISGALFDHIAGVALWLDAGVFAVASTVLVIALISQIFVPERSTTGLLNQLRSGLPLIVGSFFFVCALLEFLLWILEARQIGRAQFTYGSPTPQGTDAAVSATHHSDAVSDTYIEVPDEVLGTTLRIRKGGAELARSRRQTLALPPAWQRREVLVPGANHAFVWHGVLHVHDENDMRRISPIPPKDPQRFRIAAFGDSFTYGYGVDEQDIYTTLLQEDLGAKYQVEVINLGRSGYQSEDILRVMQEFLPTLKPDLVIYGMCLNDFLPSRVGENSPFLLPDYPHLNTQTRLYGTLNNGLSSLLLRLGLRLDFYSQINKDIDIYAKRLEHDLREMNRLITESGHPPIVSMVFDIRPEVGSLGSELTAQAEQILRDAGFDVVSAGVLDRRFNNEPIRVSAWENHPNEIAHAAYAALFRDRILLRGYLDNYRIVSTDSDRQGPQLKR